MYSLARGVVGLTPPAMAELARTINRAQMATSEQITVFKATLLRHGETLAALPRSKPERTTLAGSETSRTG